MTVDRTGNVVITDRLNHALRTVSKVGAVSTLAGNRMPGHADGRGAVASFRYPTGVVLGANGDLHSRGVAGGGGAVIPCTLVLVAQSEYFQGLFLSDMQDAPRDLSGSHKVELEGVSAWVLRVLLRNLYTSEVPAGEDTGGSGGVAKGGKG